MDEAILVSQEMTWKPSNFKRKCQEVQNRGFLFVWRESWSIAKNVPHEEKGQLTGA